ncbi:MAG: hypothetical protein VX938_07725, partial [Myxococcota bacterium]|nr:hypothetical protein [Myxococcota bacterium]
AMSEAVFDAQLIYQNWNDGEPNDWGGDEDVVGLLDSGLWNDFNGDQTLNCYVCTRPTTEAQYTGYSDPGMGIYLGPELIDDGDHSQPPDDLGTVLEMLFGGFDLGKLIPSPAATGLEAAGATYDLYITDVFNDEPTVSLGLIDGGWSLTAELKNVSAPLEAYKTGGSWLLPGEITGTLYIESIFITSDVKLGVTEDHQLEAWAENSTVTANGASIDIDGLLGGLIEGALEDSLDDLLDDVEETLAAELGGALAPLLVDALGSLAFGFDFELPSLNPEGAPVQMKVATDFSSVDFGTEGDVIYLRSVAIPSDAIVLHESNGTPAREGCGVVEQSLDITQEAPMEIVMNDDTINMIFYAAWRGGFLEFDLPPDALGDVDLEVLGVKGLEAQISGLLPPTISDCHGGELLLHMGDIRLDATMEFLEKPLDLVAYAAFDAKFEILAADGEISFGISDVGNVKLELSVVQEDQIENEWLLAMVIEENLVPALVDGLTGESLGGLEIPNIEIDAAGTPVEIGIEPLWVERSNGNSIVGADLAFVGAEDEDLAEGDLASWSTGCEGDCESSVEGDAELTKVGALSVRAETNALEDFWVGVETVGGPSWSIDPDGVVSLFLRTEESNSAGWDGSGLPMLELRDAGGA